MDENLIFYFIKKMEIPAFLLKFNEANAFGLQHIAEVVVNIDYPLYDLTIYYTQNISYNFDASKQEGLNNFLNYLKESDQ